MISTSNVRHFSCVWFVPCDGGDFFGVLYQKHDAKWELQYRFRYYTGDDTVDPFDSDDEKSFYIVKFHEGTKVPEMEAKVDDIVRAVFVRAGGTKKIEKVEVKGDVTKFFEVMAKQPWAHMKFEGDAAKA